MKLKKSICRLVGLSFVMSLALTASAFAAPKLDKTSVTMNVRQKRDSSNYGIILTVKNAKKVSSWFTDDPTVANITPSGSKCYVFGLGYGTATVSVKADGKTLTSKITVRDPHPDYGVSMPYSGYKKLTKAAKGRVSDVLAIARSQNGYGGIVRNGCRRAYFGSKWDTYAMNEHDADGAGAWCSDFASWCLFAARVPNSRGLYDIVNGYASDRTVTRFYGNKYNSLYRYAPSYARYPNSINARLAGVKIRGTLNAKTIMPGDIAVVNSGHHTTIVASVNRSSGAVQVVEGNCGNRVRTDRWISADQVWFVARPAYNK